MRKIFMNVTGIANLYASLQTTSVSSGSKVSRSFDQAANRLENELQSTEVKLSAYGQVKAGFAGIEAAGQTLAKGDKVSAADTKKALQSLVDAYNQTRSAAAGTEPGFATNAANSLRRSVASSGMNDELQALGITRGSDGSLALDTKKLDAALAADTGAVQKAAASLGSAMQPVATRALSESGGINRTLESLNARASSLEGQQSGIASLIELQKQSGSYGASSGIASYLSIFRM
jgi:flagellar capping protein FliD